MEKLANKRSLLLKKVVDIVNSYMYNFIVASFSLLERREYAQDT